MIRGLELRDPLPVDAAGRPARFGIDIPATRQPLWWI
jgi:hypothetical protein